VTRFNIIYGDPSASSSSPYRTSKEGCTSTAFDLKSLSGTIIDQNVRHCSLQGTWASAPPQSPQSARHSLAQNCQIYISSAELDLLTAKIRLTRLPTNHQFDWTEENGLTPDLVSEVVKFWQSKYSWRDEEARINAALPQFTTSINVDDGFGTLDIHFVHKRSANPGREGIPLLFVHGWPGSFLEIEKGLAPLNDAGFDVVAPSLPGFGFSSYTTKRGFDIRRHAEVFNKLMHKLGHKRYVVQGGDWGSWVVRSMALLYPESIMAVHLNMVSDFSAFSNSTARALSTALMLGTHVLTQEPQFKTFKPDFRGRQEPEYSDFEKHSLDRFYNWFIKRNLDYGNIQAARPQTLGYAMHDSPVGLLVWIWDKLRLWSDNYPWSPTELITWTLMHYWPGPTPGYTIYMENNPPAMMIPGSWADKYLEMPCGFSAFPSELGILPRSWAEQVANVRFWREHPSGGHFAMHERPTELVADLIDFFGSVWDEETKNSQCSSVRQVP
jgi:pimeloyl-ACP methyl ester carboxylesterase